MAKLQGLAVHDAAGKSLPEVDGPVPACRLWLQGRHRGAAGFCAGTRARAAWSRGLLPSTQRMRAVLMQLCSMAGVVAGGQRLVSTAGFV